MRRRGCGRRSGAWPTLLTPVHAATPLGRACRLRVPASPCVPCARLRRRAAPHSSLLNALDQATRALTSSHVAGCCPVRPACNPLHPGKEKTKKTVTWVGPNGQSKKSLVVPGQKLRDIARVSLQQNHCRYTRSYMRRCVCMCTCMCICACMCMCVCVCMCMCSRRAWCCPLPLCSLPTAPMLATPSRRASRLSTTATRAPARHARLCWTGARSRSAWCVCW